MASVSTPRIVSAWPIVVLPALALSIGWGVRGNFGHEHGAMLPGALAAMAAVLVCARPDWHRRIAFFALFGAIGWAFGGSMSYGHVLSYAHCGEPWNVSYGFASLFLIGFLWAALGAAGTALPAYLTRERLTGLMPPLICFFVVLSIVDLVYEPLNVWLATRLTGSSIAGSVNFRHEEPLYWFDADWLTAVVGIVVALAYRAARRRSDAGTSLILHLAVGWCVGFLLFPVLLNWRMTPPRGDNWAGCVGAVGGMWVYLQRNGLSGVMRASLMCGVIGGVGFALATAFEILWTKTGWQTNWHSVLEQTYGLINGIGVGIAMLYVARSAPEVSDDPPVRRWTDWFAPACVLVLVTYLNARKNPESWVKDGAMEATLYWLQPITWFNIGYAAIAAAVIWVLVSHMRRPTPLLSVSWHGKAQGLFLALLWSVVAFNFEKAIPAFSPQRLITEGVILLNACLVSVLCVTWAGACSFVLDDDAERVKRSLRRWAALAVPAAACCIVVCLGLTLAAYGTRPVDFRTPQFRFGPNATATDERPKPGVAHP